MKPWVGKALECLKASLEEPKHELNELDWKAALSPDKKRLSEHLSAFSNHPGGGFLVFGVDNSGAPQGVHAKTVETTINQLANLGRTAVEPPIALDHSVETYNSVRLLLVHISEGVVKPIHIRGSGLDNAFIRSGGTTRRASRQEVGMLMLHSKTPKWEDLRVSVLLSEAEAVEMLSTEPILEMLGRPQPSTQIELIEWMIAEKFVLREPAGGLYITNLGAIAAARKLSSFGDLSRKAIRIVVYNGLNKSKTKLEREGTRGYAITFQHILTYVTSLLPQSEIIEKALRQRLIPIITVDLP